MLSCVCCFLVLLSLSHMVCWVSCGARLSRFLMFAYLLVMVEIYEFFEMIIDYTDES